jgi:putative DNA primase/helicase
VSAKPVDINAFVSANGSGAFRDAFDAKVTPFPGSATREEAPSTLGPLLGPAAKASEELITEDGVALEFAELYADRLRYCIDRRAWLEWDGTIWRTDRKRRAFQYARALARKVAQEAPGRLKATPSKVAFAANVETFAQTDKLLVSEYDDWDLDRYLLGTPGGTVDLRSGKLRPPRQSDMITRTTAVAPADTANCPQFLNFLHETFQGDAGTIRFVQ